MFGDDPKKWRHNYLKLCRQYHPDKHPNATDAEKMEYNRKFTEIQEAYRKLPTTKDEKMLHCIISGFPMEFIISKLDHEALILLREMIVKYKDYISMEYYNRLIEWINKYNLEWKEPVEVINPAGNSIYTVRLYPTLNDLMVGKVHCSHYENMSYYVPLWGNYICMTPVEFHITPVLWVGDDSGNPICTDISMEAPNVIIRQHCEYNVYGLYIDDDNDLHISVIAYVMPIFDRQGFPFEIYLGVDEEYKSFYIPIEKITMKREQTIVLTGEGIPRMNKIDIYDDSMKGDIYVRLILTGV
jgi:hypothetical protein